MSGGFPIANPSLAAERRLGIALVVAAAVLWSLAGLFTRLIALDVWTLLFWRAVFGGALMFAYLVFEHRGRSLAVFGRIGALGWGAAAICAIAMIAYVAALKLTSVANVLVIYAMTPFFAAGIAFAWTGERPSRRTLIASAVSLAGVAVMVSGSARSGRLMGDALALLMTGFFAFSIVMARRDPNFSMTPVNVIAALLCAMVCWPLSQAGVPGPQDLVLVALFGFCTIGGAFVLYMAGAKRLPAAETGLIGLIDTVLGPLWVWLAFQELPGAAALAGGAIVLSAVTWYMATELRGERMARAG